MPIKIDMNDPEEIGNSIENREVAAKKAAGGVKSINIEPTPRILSWSECPKTSLNKNDFLIFLFSYLI